MAEPGLILVTGAGGARGGVGVGNKVVALLRERGRPVRAMVHHDDDERADDLRALGADVVVGDLTRPGDVAKALDSVQRMFFSMSLSPSLLEAAATVATVARAVGHLDALVAISQMTVSQMDALQHRASPTISGCIGCRSRCSTGPVFRSYTFAPPSSWTPGCSRLWLRSSIADSGTIRLPFGTGRTSPIASDDVARVVATVLADPEPYLGGVLELTGPRSQDMNGVAEEYARALGKPVSYVDVPWDTWAAETLPYANLGPYVEAHVAVMARLHRENRYDRADRHGREDHRPARGVRRGVRRAAKRPVRWVTYRKSATSGLRIVVLAALGQAGRVRGGFGAAAHAQLGQQVGHVVLDGLLGQEELLADLAVGHTLGDEIEDAALLVGETGELVRVRRVAQPLEHSGGQRRVEERLAAADSADAVDEVGAAHLLQHVAGGARHDRAEQGLVVGEGGQHQAGDLGMRGAELAAHLDAVAVGQAHVEDGDIGLVAGMRA